MILFEKSEMDYCSASSPDLASTEPGRGSSKLKLFPSKVPDTKVAFTKTFDIAS